MSRLMWWSCVLGAIVAGTSACLALGSSSVVARIQDFTLLHARSPTLYRVIQVVLKPYGTYEAVVGAPLNVRIGLWQYGVPFRWRVESHPQRILPADEMEFTVPPKAGEIVVKVPTATRDILWWPLAGSLIAWISLAAAVIWMGMWPLRSRRSNAERVLSL